MIKLIPDPVFKARVPFSVPGKETPDTIEIEFAHKSPAALSAWWATVKEQSIPAAMAAVVRGWAGVIDASGSDVPYTPEALEQFLAGSATRGEELVRAYMRELTESRIKN